LIYAIYLVLNIISVLISTESFEMEPGDDDLVIWQYETDLVLTSLISNGSVLLVGEIRVQGYITSISSSRRQSSPITFDRYSLMIDSSRATSCLADNPLHSINT